MAEQRVSGEVREPVMEYAIDLNNCIQFPRYIQLIEQLFYFIP